MPIPALPDWRDDQGYASLRDLDPPLLAWEWLRRDISYGPAFHDHQRRSDAVAGDAGSFGLHHFIDPILPARHARPMWCAERMSGILQVRAAPCDDEGEAFDLVRFSALASLSRSNDGQHLLLCDGRALLRIDVLAGDVAQGSVRFHYALSGFSGLSGPLLTLHRLHHLVRSGVLMRDCSSDRKAARMISLLRTADALAGGASQREIATVLLDADAARTNWRLDQPSLRSRVQRLVRLARQMQEGGFWALLR